eukprot:TRINITY_DN38894_c0_g1_i1.p1 TRINITY_DN38894_c0_g1~~TRINITY_DN38894_c0_g1_i1.p1  ORF type:complete len:523 (-),score=85.53 TRINITY_DN38894_c0_g1_i1:106-1674(-)
MEWDGPSWKADSSMASAGVVGCSHSTVGPATVAVATAAAKIVIQRTEGQVFRERLGFIILCIIGAYCTMCILVELKSILEPCLWAFFLVMAWKPVVDAIELRTERALGMFCCGLRTEASSSPSLASEGDELPAELIHILGDQEHQPVNPPTVISKNDSSTDLVERDSKSHRLRSASAMPQGQRPRARENCQDLDGDDDQRAQRTKALWRQRLARSLAVLIALMLTVGLLSGFGFLILESARGMRSHWDVYQKGAQKLTNDAVFVLDKLFKKVPARIRRRYEDVTSDVMTSAQDFLYALVGKLVNSVTSFLLSGLLTLLYTLFWLCSPVPMDSSIDIMFRRYIMFKTLVCFGYGICVGTLLAFLSVDLASVFALTTFALNYVPEVGPFVAMVLPCPVILLDSRFERPFLVLLSALGGQLALKFAFSNILEVKLIESDKKLRMHPVMILLSVGILGYLWGATGMLLSVPLMALVKIALFADLVPSSYRDPILVLLEGDRDAPRKHCQLIGEPSPQSRCTAALTM